MKELEDLTPAELAQWEDEFNQHQVPIPRYWIVNKKNPFAKIGTLFRRFRDGYEQVIRGEGKTCREMYGYEGLVLPHETLAPYILAVKAHGLDAGAARQDRRRAMGRHGEY